MNPVQATWEWIAYSPSREAQEVRILACVLAAVGYSDPTDLGLAVVFAITVVFALTLANPRPRVTTPTKPEEIVWDECRCPTTRRDPQAVVVSYPEFGLAPGYQETVGYVCGWCRGVVDWVDVSAFEARKEAERARSRAKEFALRARVPEVCDCCSQWVFEPDHGGCSESGKPVVTVQTATVEEVQDVVAATLTGQGVAVHYDDTAGTMTITAREAVWDPCTGRYLGEIEEVRSWDGTVTATHIVR